MKRVLVEKLAGVGEIIVPPRDEAHHLTRVRRSESGEHLEVLDGNGGGVLGELQVVGKQVEIKVIRVLDEDREAALNVHVCLAIPSQKSTLDGLIPGLVQLGVKHIHLAPTQYGGRIKGDKEKYLARLDQIALQSLKQCGRLFVPTIHVYNSWQALLDKTTAVGGTHLLCHPTKRDGALPAKGDHQLIHIYIGSEGGFNEQEVEVALASGVRLVDLGPRILKMETAVIALVGAINYELLR